MDPLIPYTLAWPFAVRLTVLTCAGLGGGLLVAVVAQRAFGRRARMLFGV